MQAWSRLRRFSCWPPALALAGVALLLASKAGISRLPGDVTIRKGNFTFYAPIGLMIILSVAGTLLLNLILRR